MNLTEFFEAADQLDNQVRRLRQVVRFRLVQAEDAICRKDHPLANDYLPRTFGMNCVRTIRDAIENVMAAHERLAQTVEMLPYFQSFFDSLDAPEDVR
jgi:hypothetical protein